MSRLITLAVFTVLLALPASAGVKFMAMADPQIGRRCSDSSITWPPFENISVTECRTFQANMANALLTYAEDIGVDFVWVLGDLTDGTSSVESNTLLRTVIEAHPSLTYHWVNGNHDAGTECANMESWVTNRLTQSPAVRRPHWETWQVGGIHFMSLNSMLWDSYAWHCYGLANDGNCQAIGGASSGVCTAGTTGAGRSTCGATEACEDYDAYAANQMTAVTAAITAKEADSNAKAMFFGTHQTAWPHDNANVVTMDDSNNAFHNLMQCTGGTNDGYYCNDVVGLDCPGGGACTASVCVGGTRDTETCTRCDGGACDSAVANNDWRSQFEAELANLSTTAYILSGHAHDDLDWSGTTSPSGADYESYSICGSSAPTVDADPLTAMIVEVDDSGTPTFTRILATWQGVEVYGAKLSGVSLP